jgi:hypothetical protein
MSSDDDDRSPEREPTAQARQGLGLLWRAARGAVRGLRHELDDSKFGRTLDDATRTVGDAGQELVRAAENVAGRVSAELQKAGFEVERRLRSRKDGVESPGVEDEPTGPTKSDPGFRIANEEDEGRRDHRHGGGSD